MYVRLMMFWWWFQGLTNETDIVERAKMRMKTQVIYPDTQLEMGRKGWTDGDLEKVIVLMMIVTMMMLRLDYCDDG